jgi:uncharacterized protein (TIGR02271 family)
MATQNPNINGVIGYFETRSQAEHAIEDLKQCGFQAEQLGIATHSSGEKADSIWDRIVNFFQGNKDQNVKTNFTNDTEIDNNYECDYDAAGFRGSLGTLGASEERARYFEHQLSGAGEGTLVTVKAMGREREAEQILERNGGDIGANAGAFEYPAANSGEEPARRKIQLLGEVLRVHKEEVSRGEVRMRKEVVTENQTVEVPITREELVIERHTGEKGAPTGEIGSESEIRIPLTEERVTVEKRPTVREEVEVGKRRVKQTQRVSDEVRHEELRIEKDGKVEIKEDASEKEPSQRKTA